MNYNIIKEIGHGMYGRTYEIEMNNKFYALKKQKILKTELRKNYAYLLWRELEFYKWINKLDDTDRCFFMQLYNYEIDNNCNMTLERVVNTAYTQKLNASKICVNFILDLKDGVLDHLQLNNNETKSMIIQVLYMIYLMRKDKWMHLDIHPGNIGYTKISKNTKLTLKINNKKYKINSYGYQFCLIDYGLCYNLKFKVPKETKYMKESFNNNFDLWCFIQDVLLHGYDIYKDINRYDIDTRDSVDTLINTFYDKYKKDYDMIKKIICKTNKYTKYFNSYEKNHKIDNSIKNLLFQYIMTIKPKLYYAILDIPYKKPMIDIKTLHYFKTNKIENIIKFML